MLNFDATRSEIDIIVKIAERVERDVPNYPDKRQTLIMDLTVAKNDVPISLPTLLNFPLADFAHDIYGIRGHLNRRTGKLEDCFLPRSVRHSHATK